MTLSRLILVVSGFAMFSATFSPRASEPWTDPRLILTNGLALWLDVSRQNAARGGLGLAPLQSWRDAPDYLLDGSENRRHLEQALLDARPRFRQDFDGAKLSFDGTNDFLAAAGLGKVSADLTIFVVAAPRTNGGYRALAAFNAAGQNDYTSGINLDFGSAPSPSLARVNAEGAGFTGEKNLLVAADVRGLTSPGVKAGESEPPHDGPYRLGSWHVFTLVIGRGSGGVKFFLDGQPQGDCDRATNSILRCDEFTLGARRYSNTPDRPHVQGFFQGELTEVLVFDRALAEAERIVVEKYLDAKYGALIRGLNNAPVSEGAAPLVTVTNPPPVQIFAPGFSARELPVALNNVNNVRYRADGKLVAVGYDGRIWLLSDTNGDGLEDTAFPFWDKQTLRAPIGAALTPPGYPRGQGLFVAAKDKLALIVDTNGDDHADEEIIVATWTERSEQQGVDALGVAIGPDGSIYFSLGAASFTEPYLIDKATGAARYRTSMERGTIQRVSPDFSKRETVSTGIRFAVGLAFNRDGDLFCTDQEGATWSPNGNPLDELLHVQTGRHFGFPPRHPKHLPNVIDEPSVFDYAPQHQSTCGLCFNEPSSVTANVSSRAAQNSTRADRVLTNGATAFGPTHWQGDALVTGYSRGKIWRTKLMKTAAGYVAQTRLLATLQALTVDACVSPRGDLIVATHGGLPDWGTGPNGQGKLWRIRYEDREAPQPVAAWNESPTELKVAFDRPLDPPALKDLAKRARIESGKYVSPGDRFETVRPGYQIVYDQLATPRYAHEVLGSQLSPDRRTVTLVTRPRIAAVNYAVTLPALVAADVSPRSVANLQSQSERNRPRSHERSYEEMDLLTDLTGVEARWQSADGKESRTVWLPHLDLESARTFTALSSEHAWSPKAAGTLTLRGQLDLSQMLQPATQPGSTIDWERPPETLTVTFEASRPFSGKVADQNVKSTLSEGNQERARVTILAPGKTWQPFELRVATDVQPLKFTVWWSAAEDPRPRAFPLRRLLMPFARPESASPIAASERQIPEIAGGNWLHGRRLFFSEKAACAKCHAVRGEGARVGPDLSNLVHRDYASVRKDIQFPNAAMNPDHVASLIELAEGDLLTGIVQSEADGVLTLLDTSGQVRRIPRAQVKTVRLASVSLMPEGIWEAMSEIERRDLMTFLLSVPLEPYPVPFEAQGQPAPPVRKREEIQAALAGSHAPRPTLLASTDASQSLLTSAATPMRIVLCASEKDPGHRAPGFHDYPLWRERWAKLLSLADGVQVEVADRWPSEQQWRRASVIVFYHDNPAWDATKAKDLDAFLERGGGLVFLHWSMNAYRDVDLLAQRLGRAWGSGSRFRYGREMLQLQTDPITAGLEALQIVDESYWNLKGSFSDAKVLATSIEDGAPQPQIWIRSQGKGRLFVCIPGHFTWTFDDPLYRVLLLRGICWAGGQPLDRLSELATVGARLGE